MGTGIDEIAKQFEEAVKYYRKHKMNTKHFTDWIREKNSKKYEERVKWQILSRDRIRRKAFAERLGLDFRNDITELCKVWCDK